METSIHLCNLVASGISLAKAKEILATKKAKAIEAAANNKKPTAQEKKDSLAARIEELGGTVPPGRISVAVYQQIVNDLEKKAKDVVEVVEDAQGEDAQGEDAQGEDLM